MLEILKKSLSARQKKYLRYYLFSSLSAVGVKKSPSLFEIDKKIEPYLQPATRKGFFIEAGGNDGVTQSNTFHLEQHYGWTGFIVEPIPWLNDLAKRFRRCDVETCALGRFSERGASISLEENDLVTRVTSDAASTKRVVTAPVEPLSDILDRRGVSEVDFFSLDVEGHENAVLEGIDFDRHLINLMLIETKDVGALSIDWRRYQEPIAISHHDYLILCKPN